MTSYQYYSTIVKAASRLTPNMVRVIVEGDDLAGFQSSGMPDEFVYLLFPPAGAKTAVLPQQSDAESGLWYYPEGVTEPAGRYYTIRRWDAVRCELLIDFAIHEGGIGAAWAMRAKAGDPLGVRRPTARFNIPADCDWICLLADFTGLPAVGRIVEEMPAGRAIVSHIEIPSGADRQLFERPCDVAVHWYETFCRDGCATRLHEIARSVVLPDGPGYVWIAGEATAVSESRKYFRDVLGFDKDRITSVGYWIEGQVRG
ncbi:siderophore-interacting protein [Agrobacterium leguminum]|uniref:siderophore-interacting protein n=1 Tax=Agrobacterium leguminum TaxID=2792015 RepID=UPI003CE4CA13